MIGGKKSRLNLCYFFAAFLILSASFAPLPVFATTADIEIDLHSCTSELKSAPENSSADIVWNYLIATGIKGFSGNAAAIAGLMSNMKQDSDFDPYLQNGNRYGLLQWSAEDPATATLLDQINTLGEYWHDQTTENSAPDDIVKKAIKLQLDYLIGQDEFKNFFHQLNNTDYLSGESGAKSYSELFLVLYQDKDSIEGSDALTDSYVRNYASRTRYPAASKRRSYAQALYNIYYSPDEDIISRQNSPSLLAQKSPTLNLATTNPETSSFTLAVNGSYNWDAVYSAKNADKQSTDFPSSYASFDDLNPATMKNLLETYGDLAYQLGNVVGVPYVAILVQMRYEDPGSVCGRNNFWGNGCPSGTGAGGASIQGKDLGEGFIQYGKTLTNGLHNQALDEPDPKRYLEKIGPTWVQGSITGAGYGLIDGMRNSVDALMAYIDTPEGQAIVKNFGNYAGTYHGSSNGISGHYGNGCDNISGGSSGGSSSDTPVGSTTGYLPGGTREQREAWLFPEGTPQTLEAMEPYLTTIQVPILNGSGEKDTYALRVHKKLIAGYNASFEDMLKVGFRTTKDTEAFRWEPQIPGASIKIMSVHSMGGAIDLNPNVNPFLETKNNPDFSIYKAVSNDPTIVDDEIVTIWLNNSFWWGGCFTNAADLQHFSYTELGAQRDRYPICAKQ